MNHFQYNRFFYPLLKLQNTDIFFPVHIQAQAQHAINCLEFKCQARVDDLSTVIVYF